MVGRLVQQQQVGCGEQGGGERHAHAPAAGEAVHRPGLGGCVEAQTGEDSGRAGRGRICADGAQALVDFGKARGVGGVQLAQQGQTLGVALQHGIQQRLRTGWRGLAHLRHPGARRKPNVAAIGGKLAGDGTQQGRFARAVAPDQADAAPGIDRQIGTVQQGAARHAQSEAGDGEQGHRPVIGREQ